MNQLQQRPRQQQQQQQSLVVQQQAQEQQQLHVQDHGNGAAIEDHQAETSPGSAFALDGMLGELDAVLGSGERFEQEPEQLIGLEGSGRERTRQNLLASDQASVSTATVAYTVLESSVEDGLRLDGTQDTEVDEEWTSWNDVFSGRFDSVNSGRESTSALARSSLG